MKTCNKTNVLFLLVAFSFSLGSFAASGLSNHTVSHEFTITSDSQLIFIPRKSENGEKEKETKKKSSEDSIGEAKEEVSEVKSAPGMMLDAVSGATSPLKDDEKNKEFSKLTPSNKSQNAEEIFWLRKKARPDVEFSPFPMVM